jgi:mono/diheme cytochrome c family protein
LLLRSINARQTARRRLKTMWKRAQVFILAAIALSGCATTPQSVFSPPINYGDAALGRAFAQQTCASCHAINAGDLASPDARARSFDAIANTPGLTRMALNAWLHTSHTNMPNLIVDPDSTDDLHAYLMTLKRD